MNLAIILKFKQLYIDWHILLLTFPKVYKNSLGNTMDKHVLSALEKVYMYLQETTPERRLFYLKQSNAELDIFKLLLEVAYANKSINIKQLQTKTEQTTEIGRILGSWKKSLSSQTKKPI